MYAINQVIGHRGASAYAPENTLASFNKALAMGCQFVEFDVVLSADGVPFVFHDESLKRTSSGKGQIGKVEAAYLESLDAGKWFSRKFKGEKIPQFTEVLKWLIFTNTNANIEIKPYPGTSQETSMAVISHLHQYWPSTKTLPLISSFDKSALEFCRSLAPELPLGLLLDKWEDSWHITAKQLDCYSIHPNFKCLTEQRVKDLKKENYKVFAYTVNSKRQAKKILAWGVDAVYSDYPDLLL